MDSLNFWLHSVFSKDIRLVFVKHWLAGFVCQLWASPQVTWAQFWHWLIILEGLTAHMDPTSLTNGPIHMRRVETHLEFSARYCGETQSWFVFLILRCVVFCHFVTSAAGSLVTGASLLRLNNIFKVVPPAAVVVSEDYVTSSSGVFKLYLLAGFTLIQWLINWRTESHLFCLSLKSVSVCSFVFSCLLGHFSPLVFCVLSFIPSLNCVPVSCDFSLEPAHKGEHIAHRCHTLVSMHFETNTPRTPTERPLPRSSVIVFAPMALMVLFDLNWCDYGLMIKHALRLTR